MFWLLCCLLLYICSSNVFVYGQSPSRYSTKTCNQNDFRFSNLYQDGMVLQREPESATIWGYGTLPDGAEATVTCSSTSKERSKFNVIPFQEEDGTWKLELKPQTGGSVCSIEVNLGCGGQISINEVLFGDVYLCSGQSNMVRHLSQVMNATAEVEKTATYNNIRFTRIPEASLNAPDDALDISLVHKWANPSDPEMHENLKFMSAVCILYARNIYDKLGIPLGLIASAYGGTPVESWSSLEMLGKCGLANEQTQYDLVGPKCKGCLYNKMIYPMRKNTFKGFLWYQGEANVAYNRDLYNCTFPAKISGWRSVFSSNSNTNSNAPYGFVQLSTDKYGNTDLSTPLIRWHQTADYGVVPNDALNNVFMSVAIDTYDEVGGIHPRYKQVVAERLATAGMNMVYGDKSFPLNGPMVTNMEVISGPILSLTYDQKITYNNEEISGFYYCCKEYDDCDRGSNKNWLEIGKELVEFDGVTEISINIKIGELVACEIEVPHLAYLWRQTPVKNYLGAPIYAKDGVWPSGIGLPSPPWKTPAASS